MLIPPRALALALIALPLAACESSPSPSPSPSAAATATPEKPTPSAAPQPSPSSPPEAAPSSQPGAAPSSSSQDAPADPSLAASAAALLAAPPDVAAAPADAKKTASGLASKILSPSKGKDHPGPDDLVKVNYTGWTKAGKRFDSSITHGEPISLRLSEVIKGWTEGIQLMVKGEKRRFWIPSALAYGDPPKMMGAPAGDLVFDVELLDFTPAPKPPPVPQDVRAVPKTATKTASGLAYRVLKKGTKTQQPKATDTVLVHYTGWTTDGKMFDSSVTRGEPITFPLNRVIKGWTEGVQLMKVGEVTRFWIPADLAYGEKPGGGKPGGMLVFDIELLDIK